MDIVNSLKTSPIDLLNDLLADIFTSFAQKQPPALIIKRMLRFIYKLLVDKEWSLSSAIFHQLISIAFHTSDGNAHTFSEEDRQLVSNVLECLHLKVAQVSNVEAQVLLDHLWNLCQSGDQLHPLAAQIIVQLFDDFFRVFNSERFLQLLKLIPEFLRSMEKNDRHAAYFLMHKLEEIFETNIVVADALKCTKEQWSLYIAIMEHLEEQQMHPQLDNFMDNVNPVNNNYCLIITLYRKLLKCDNISVVYPTVKFIKLHFTPSQLIEWGMMYDFLEATNRRQLYNFDDDDRSYPLFKNFLVIEEIRPFMVVLVNVPFEWNGVALCEWLKSISELDAIQIPSIKQGLIFRLGTHVEKLDDPKLRAIAQMLVVRSFWATLDSLSLMFYLNFVKLLYRKDYNYADHDRLESKVIGCVDFESQIPFFDEDCFKIIFKVNYDDRYIFAFMDKLWELPKSQHGWLRFAILFKTTSPQYSERILKFCIDMYDLHHNWYSKDLESLQSHLLEQMMCTSPEEAAFVIQFSVDFFVNRNIKSLTGFQRVQCRAEDYIKGGWVTCTKLASLLGKCRDQVYDHDVLPAYLALLKKYPSYSGAENVGRYASKNLTHEEQILLSVAIIKEHMDYYPKCNVVLGLLNSKITVPVRQILPGIFYKVDLPEYAWVDELYSESLSLYLNFITYVSKQYFPFVKAVTDDLLREMEHSNRDYLRNSREHRHRFRIAVALLHLREKYKCSDQLWKALFAREKFNITCIYELILGKILSSPLEIVTQWDSIFTLDPNQQISLVSVAHIFLMQNQWLNVRNDLIQTIVSNIFLLATGLQVQVSIFAKLVLNRLIVKSEQEGFQLALDPAVHSTIESHLAGISVGPELEARLLLAEMDPKFIDNSWEFYMSNIKPSSLTDDEELVKMKKFRSLLKSVLTQPVQEVNTNITPISDMYPIPDLDNVLFKNTHIIPVAALIEDIAILNDLIVTCKALGITSMVLSDSINLSPNMEASFNIERVNSEVLGEYLIRKRLENYNIVGTENTAQNTNFVDFTFEGKTVLLLGHDENGIPENLKFLLHNTVQLPHDDFKHAQKLMIFKFQKQYSV